MTGLYLWKIVVATSWPELSLEELVELTNNRSAFVIDGQEYGIQIGGL